MADKKISELNQAITPLIGDEQIPIVQNNNTVEISVDDLIGDKTDKGGYTGTSQDLKDAIDNAVFGDLKTYETLAEFNAVSPVPADGTPFIIANDPNEANNGEWSVQGGVAVQNARTVALSVENSNTTKGVTGKGIYDFANLTKQVLVQYLNENDTININKTTNEVEFPSSFYITGISVSGIKHISNQPNLPYTTGLHINILYYDLVNNSIGLTSFLDDNFRNNPTKVILATFIPSKKTVTTNGFKISIDNSPVILSATDLLSKNIVSITYANEIDYINFNFNSNKIEFPSSFYIVGQKGASYSLFSNQSSLSFTGGFVIGIFWFDSSNNTLGVTDIFDSSFRLDVNKQVLATFIPSKKTVTTNGFKFKINDISQNGDFSELGQRLILPDKIFVTNAYPLKVYKEGLTASKLHQDNNLVSLKKDREVELIEPLLDIDSNLPNTVTIIQAPKIPNGFFYRKDLTVINTDASAKNGAKTIICLGDSLTNRGIAARTKAKIESISSVTLTPVGTMSNQEGAQGEGREGWEFENFIGKDNTHFGGTIVRQTTAGASSVLLNPFLKLADATDKANHPEWCFTNTGSNLETSYAEDDTLGNYYIFDWGYYFATQSITPPNVLTIALSTNDLNMTPTDWLENCSLGLEILLKQLDQYCIDNGINIDVGVVPTPAWGNNATGVTKWAQIVEWCEKCLFDINSYTFTNITVDVVGMWMHQDGQASFEEGNSSVGNVTTYSTVNKVSYNEYIHFGTEAKNQYADILSAFVISKL